MNAVAKTTDKQTVAVTEAQMIETLSASLYPGAKPESVLMVLSYCRAAGYDPMKKPVHIVPMNVNTGNGKYEWRDVVMPGIAQYRIDAARTGDYVGKSEPVFGPDCTETVGGQTVRFPLWCSVTVERMVHGQARKYTATERWLENYASGKSNAGVNAMWSKRPYGQLAKCAEAQALRMAFPEQTGGTNTSDEMEGKIFGGPVIEHEASPAAPRRTVSDAPALDDAPTPKKRMASEFLDAVQAELNAAQDREAVDLIYTRDDVQKALDVFRNGLHVRLNAMLKAALDRTEEPRTEAVDDFPGVTTRDAA